MKISELFFKYIKDKHLERKGVTAEDLAKAFESNGFVTILDAENCDWTDKARSGEFKREFWKCIDSAKPSCLNQTRTLCRNRMLLFLFCLGIFGQDFSALHLNAVLNMGLASTHSTRLQRAEQSPCIYFPTLKFLAFFHPSQGSVS